MNINKDYTDGAVRIFQSTPNKGLTALDRQVCDLKHSVHIEDEDWLS